MPLSRLRTSPASRCARSSHQLIRPKRRSLKQSNQEPIRARRARPPGRIHQAPGRSACLSRRSRSCSDSPARSLSAIGWCREWSRRRRRLSPPPEPHLRRCLRCHLDQDLPRCRRQGALAASRQRDRRTLTDFRYRDNKQDDFYRPGLRLYLRHASNYGIRSTMWWRRDRPPATVVAGGRRPDTSCLPSAGARDSLPSTSNFSRT